MRILFHYDTVFNMIDYITSRTWMCVEPGEGGKEIANQGWYWIKSFSQEIGAEDLRSPRNGVIEPKLEIQKQVQDARSSRNQLPNFFFQNHCGVCV
jgi:hypothetical protein